VPAHGHLIIIGPRLYFRLVYHDRSRLQTPAAKLRGQIAQPLQAAFMPVNRGIGR